MRSQGTVSLAPGRRPGARRPVGSGADAILFATTPSGDGGPSAALRLIGTTVLGHLLGQLASLGARRGYVITRPEWRERVEAATADAGLETTVLTAEDAADDLRTAAELALRGDGPLVLASAHVVTHREALAGLLADPRIVSGVLVGGRAPAGSRAFPLRSWRGRVVAAGSAFHSVGRRTNSLLDVVKVDPRDRARLAAAAGRLAGLVAARPPAWEDELERKADAWRVELWRVAAERDTGVAPAGADVPPADEIELDEPAETELARRLRDAQSDALSLLVVALVRDDVDLTPSSIRGFYFAAPLSGSAAELAATELAARDEDRILLDSAVKASDGFFTTFLVSPYSRYLARFAARRGWTPNAVTTVSLGIGAGAAAAFAVGERWSLVLGAILLQVAFTVDCVDGQLARYTRTFSKLGAWLDSVFDRAKEYLVYAGLAIGSTRGFGDDVWILAAAALTLQTFRHMCDFTYVAGDRETAAAVPPPPLEEPADVPVPAGGPARPAPAPAEPPPERRPLVRAAVTFVQRARRSSHARWVHKVLRLPIGERFALVSIAAAVSTPRVTFVALLAWGGFAAVYAVAGRLVFAYGLTGKVVRAVLR